MEEIILKEAEANYLKSAVNMLQGYLVLTNKRIYYSGVQVRVKFNHGAIGNIIRDKMEEKLGYNNPKEEAVFDIPISEVQHRLKRFLFSKRLVLKDKTNTEYQLMLVAKNTELNVWQQAIDEAKKNTV